MEVRMYCVEMKEVHQKTMFSRVYVNFNLTRYCKDIEEVNENIKALQEDLKSANIIQVKTWKEKKLIARRIEYQRPGQGCGHQVRTIVIRNYNKPKRNDELI